MSEIHPVILCGGSGTRLWPVSRKSFPKQFTRLTDDESLFQQTAKRLEGLEFAPLIVVTANDYRFIVTEQLTACEISPETVLIEPDARNTAPAILSAALYLDALEPGALMLVAPSDHVIVDDIAFKSTVRSGIADAQAGNIITFGITPDRPETAYGYMEVDPASNGAPSNARKVIRFIEKPDKESAAELLASGDALWNSGMFLFSTAAIISAARKSCPELLAFVQEAVCGADVDLEFTRLGAEQWSKAPDISIDYAIMEHADNIVAIPYSSGWSDLGSWDSIWQEGSRDKAGNMISSNAAAIDCTETIIRSDSTRIEVVGIDLSDMIVVATSDAVLVAPKASAQRVKEAVTQLNSRSAAQATSLPIDYRPWGWFESLAVGDRFQVKRIHVKPGAALSLQSHVHRSEHWVVVEGTAQVTIGDEIQLVTENQSVYIPVGTRHRLKNPGKLPLVLIEIQTGGYLGEDDIERFEDVYSRP